MPLLRGDPEAIEQFVPSPQRMYWWLPAASTMSTSSSSARPVVVSGRTAIARTGRAPVPSSLPAVTVGGPESAIASWSPLSSRYSRATRSAICFVLATSEPEGCHADHFGAGAESGRATSTSRAPTPTPAISASPT